MLYRYLSACILFFLTLVVLSCSKDAVTRSSLDTNILFYSSFEKICRPSLDGWYPDSTTIYMEFSRDVPSNGGFWSLSINNTLKPQDMRVMGETSTLSGTTSYRFSFWAKAKGVPGHAMLGARRTGHAYAMKAIGVESDSTWIQYSDSLTVDGDTNVYVVFGLSGRSTYSSGTTWFDLVKLEKID